MRNTKSYYEQWFNDSYVTNLYLNESELYELSVKVPVVRSALEVRAKAISGVPYTVVKDGVELNHFPNLRPLLRLAEKSYCVFGVGYWHLKTNIIGMLSDIECLPTPSVTPVYDNTGLCYYRFTVPYGMQDGNTVDNIPPEDIIEFKDTSLATGVYPEYSLLYSAANSSGVLRGLQEYSVEYFRRGAMRNTLLQIDTHISDKEADKLKTWWRKMLSGVKSAFNTEVIRSTVNPLTIGDGLTELDTNDIVKSYREDIVSALGVPYTMVYSNAANYATASEERLSFYDNTVIPQLRWYERIINDAIDATLTFHPEQLEVYQTVEVEKAYKLISLVRSGVITEEEAREMLNMDER